MMIQVVPVTPEWAEALAKGDEAFTERFGIPAERDWSGFSEAITLMLDYTGRGDPPEWGPHLFFEEGVLVGNGGWKGPPVDGKAELGYAVAPARQGRGIATAAVLQLLNSAARSTRVRAVVAHTLAQESASTTVLRRCGFAKVGEIVDPTDGPVWRWERNL